jgi:hypothetical protein
MTGEDLRAVFLGVLFVAMAVIYSIKWTRDLDRADRQRAEPCGPLRPNVLLYRVNSHDTERYNGQVFKF